MGVTGARWSSAIEDAGEFTAERIYENSTETPAGAISLTFPLHRVSSFAALCYFHIFFYIYFFKSMHLSAAVMFSGHEMQ